MTDGRADDRDDDHDATGADETVCPECAVGCHLAPGSDSSRAAARAGPANPNGRLCPSGISAFEAVDNRLTQPQVRRDGDLVAVDWETAYERAVDGLATVREEAGPDALAFLGAPHCTNEENYLLGKLARLLGTNNVDNRARLCHKESARTLAERAGWPATTNSLADIGDADTILVVGANPARRQPVAFNSFIRPAVNKGTTLVHVDPVGNETTAAANLHLAPRPGTDALVLDLLSAGALSADAVDEAFVAERTTGFGTFRDGLMDLDRDRAASVAGVDTDRLGRTVDAVTAGRTAAVVGTGIEGGRGDASAPDALFNLLLLTGNVGRRGTGLHLFRGLVNEQGATDAGCVPDRLPGHQPVTDAEARERVAAEWGVEPPAEPGDDARSLLASFGDGVCGALVVGEDPAVSKRDPGWIDDRLDGLETLVVVDVARSGTTPYADVVLPAAAGLEKAGTVTNLDRQVQRLRPVVAPPDGVRTDFRILRELGERLLGGPGSTSPRVSASPLSGGSRARETFADAAPERVFAEMRRVTPLFDGVSVDGIGDGGYRWPDGEAVLYRESFDTTDGRAPFVPVQPVVDDRADGGLELVVGGRASDFGDAATAGQSLALNPDDATKREVAAGEVVVVSDGDTQVRAHAQPEESVRRGTVYLHAAVADPLVRAGAERVTVEPAGEDATAGGEP